MEDKIILNWTNLPKEIIEKITNYLHPFFKPNIRLVNKHWLKAATPVLFSNFDRIDSFNFKLLSKFRSFVNCLDNYYLDLSIIDKLISSLTVHNINQLNWDLSNLNTNVLIDILEKFKFIECISLSGIESTNFDGERDWDGIILRLLQLNKLTTFKIMLDYSSIPPKLLNSLSQFQLKELVIECDCQFIQNFVKELHKVIYIQKLDLRIQYQDSNSVTSNTISPSQLLSSSKLRHLRLSIDDYSEANVNKEYLSSELIESLSDPNCSNLSSFEWLYFTHLNLSTLFDKSIETNFQVYSSLTKLSLFCIDPYLMEIIFKHFPNLMELTFASPLVLPNNFDKNYFKPLKYLTKLLFKGLSLELREHHTIIKLLFPNVVTLNLSFITDNSQVLLRDAYYIPLLFPNLRFVLFELTEFKLDRLILDYNSPLTWENLFLTIDDSNLHLYNPLIKKCPNLINLYIYNLLDMDTIIKIDNYNINAYLVDLPASFSNNFNFYRKLD